MLLLLFLPCDIKKISEQSTLECSAWKTSCLLGLLLKSCILKLEIVLDYKLYWMDGDKNYAGIFSVSNFTTFKLFNYFRPFMFQLLSWHSYYWILIFVSLQHKTLLFWNWDNYHEVIATLFCCWIYLLLLFSLFLCLLLPIVLVNESFSSNPGVYPCV